MSPLLNRVAVFSARHRALVIGVWLVLLGGLAFVSHTAGTKYTSSVEVAGSDSAAANEVMARSFSAHLSDASPLVFHTDDGKLTDAEHRGVVESSLKAVSASPDVAAVSDPFQEGSGTLSADGRTAYANVVPAKALGELTVEEAQDIYDTASAPARGTGVDVQAGGQLGSKISKPDTEISEIVGISVAMLILVLVF